jgi:hypothetical protein
MHTEARFNSTAFNNSEAKAYFINECCYGDDLAKWMMGRLRERGIKTDDEPGQEDFGWYFDFQVAGAWHCCVLGAEHEGEWHLWLERSRGFFGSLLGLRKVGINLEAVEAIREVLTGTPEIQDLRWE